MMPLYAPNAPAQPDSFNLAIKLATLSEKRLKQRIALVIGVQGMIYIVII